MRDLYRPLGLNPAASEAEIRAAISRYTGSEFSRDVFTEILLNPRRRKVYDRAWTTLHSLGRLRANLRLKDDAWESRNHDFTTVSDGWPTFRIQQDALRSLKKTSHSNQAASAPVAERLKKKGTSKLTYIVPVVALGLILIGYILTNPSSKSGRNAPQPLQQEEPFQPAKQAPPEPTISAEESTKAYVSQLPVREFASSAKDSAEFKHLAPSMKASLLEPMKREELEGKYYNPLEPRPETQVFYVFKNPKAPLEIRTPAGEDYFIRLVPLNSKTPVMEAYIRGGSSLRVNVPLGTYTLKYATGDTWHGPALLFGKDTVYSKADADLDFRETREGYSGYTVELIKQRHGNLHTSSLSPGDF